MLKKSAGFAIVLKGRPGREEQLLLTHPTHAPWVRTYSIAKGGLEPGESQLDAAIREFKEETGHQLSQRLIDRVKSRTPDFVVQNATKVLSGWVIFIDEPEEVGMHETSLGNKTHIVYPKDQLQEAEIDWAGFVSYADANIRIAPYQVPILAEINTIRASDGDKASPYFQYYSGKVEQKKAEEGSFKWAGPSREFGSADMTRIIKIKFQAPFADATQKIFADYFIAKLKTIAKRVVVINDYKLAVMNGEELIELEVTKDGNIEATVSVSGGPNIATKEFSREKESAESFTQKIMDFISERANKVENIKKMEETTTKAESLSACKTSTDLTKIVTDSSGTVPYVPISHVCETNMGTVVPKGMYSEMINALKIVEGKIKEKYGFDLSDFVLNRLQYSPEELGIDPVKYKKASPEDQRKLMRDGLCGAMSDEQIDALALAIFNIEREDATGKGFGMIIGDQTGVGKGRVAAALIRYCIKFYNRAPIFITEKGYLFSDIYRDITDVKSDPVVPLEYKVGERQVKLKLTKSAMLNEIKLRMEEFGESKEEAEEYISNVADRGYVVESEYMVNAKYPMKLDVDKLMKANPDAPASELVRRAMSKGEGTVYGKAYLKIKPLIINAKKDETKIKDIDGNIIYEPLSENLLRSILTSKKLPKDYNLIMLTYSQINKAGITLKKEFIQKMAEGTLVICDESHNASGQSNVGEYIYDLLSSAKGAAFLSATYSKRPDNMVVYAAKTSIREADLDKEDLINAVASGGVPLQEIISSQLVAEGQMVRRERTYAGVDVLWNVLDSSMAKTGHPEFDLKDKHSVIANMFTGILRDVIRFQTEKIKPLLKKDEFLKEVLELTFGETAHVAKGKEIKEMLTSSPIFSRVFNVVNQLLFSIKAEAIADRAINYMKAGKKPVIAFANTMGSFLENMTNDEGLPLQSGDEVDTDFKLVLQKLLDNAMSISVKDPADPDKVRKLQITRDMLPAEESFEYGMVQQKINTISIGISISPIDVLLYKIKAAGFTVEEVTGRASVVNFHDNTFMKGTYQTRSKKAKTDIFRSFNENKTDCLLINQSGSTGASIQAKENKVVTHVAVKMKDGSIVSTEYKRGMIADIVVPTSLEPRNEVKQRVMIMLQAELNINTEVQKMGRIFRSGQLLPPMFEYLASAIPAEKRLQMIMQKKLHSLYANTSANQKASDELVSVVDFINKYGNKVVCEYLLSNSGLINKLGDPAKMVDKNGGISMPIPIPDDAAHKTTGRIAILEIGEQEDFYNKVGQKYKDYIRFLDEQDEYTGEVKYVDLQATTLEKRIFKVGSNLGTSLFSKNTILELCEVNNLRKPYTREEIEEFLKESLADYTAYGNNFQAAKRQQVDLIREHERDFNFKVESAKEFYDKSSAAAVEMIKTDTRYLSLLKKDPAKAAEYKRTNEESIPVEYAERKERRLATLKADYESVKNYLSKIYNGMGTNYVKGDIKVPAVILNIGIDRDERNPFTPSNIIIKLGIANGLRVLNVPLSQTAFIDTLIAEEIRDSYDAAKIISTWDNIVKASAKDRLQRWILTGNILQIMSDPIVIENVGQLIKFTQCINGKIFLRNGVRLAESFDPARMSNGRGSSFVMVSAKKCLPILDSLHWTTASSKKEKIQARKQWQLGDRTFSDYYVNDTAEWIGSPADLKDIEERAKDLGLVKSVSSYDQSHYTTSNDVKVSRARNGEDFFIEVPTYYKQFVVEEKGFSSSGSILVDQKKKGSDSERGKTTAKIDVPAMGATIDEDKMQAFLDYISFKYKSSFKVSTSVFDEYKAQMGVSDSMEMEGMVSIEESESGLAQADLKTLDPANNEVLEAVQDPVSEAAEEIQAIGSIAETPEEEQPVAQIDKALDEQAQILAEKAAFDYEKKLFSLFKILSSSRKMETGGGLLDNEFWKDLAHLWSSTHVDYVDGKWVNTGNFKGLINNTSGKYWRDDDADFAIGMANSYNVTLADVKKHNPDFTAFDYYLKKKIQKKLENLGVEFFDWQQNGFAVKGRYKGEEIEGYNYGPNKLPEEIARLIDEYNSIDAGNPQKAAGGPAGKSLKSIVAELGPRGKASQDAVVMYIHNNYKDFGGKNNALYGESNLLADLLGYYLLDWEEVQAELLSLDKKATGGAAADGDGEEVYWYLPFHAYKKAGEAIKIYAKYGDKKEFISEVQNKAGAKFQIDNLQRGYGMGKEYLKNAKVTWNNGVYYLQVGSSLERLSNDKGIANKQFELIKKGAEFTDKKEDGGEVEHRPTTVSEDDKARWREIAETILHQLGGQRRLVMMTGAHGFVIERNGISFKFANMGQKVNYVKITLKNDLYNVELGRIWGDEYKVLHSETGLYDDSLVGYIQRNSGLALHL